MSRTAAILLCAGRGERLGHDVPKAMVPLAGRPLFTWALEALQLAPSVDDVVVVGDTRMLRELLAASGRASTKIVAWVEGGAERQHSVARGLAAVPEACDLVAVHDGARALVSVDVIERAIAAAREDGAVLAAVALADTLKRVEDGVVTATPSRDGLWCAQTPQVFRRDWLVAAHAAASAVATDDAALVEAAGHAVRVSPGDTANFKITTAADLATAEALLAARPAATRREHRS
ncbi:MAG: 2-C-methyl-D-erythritol 4-phosphate cytidylyltransferase [Candidatus Eisenbacteria bacterium]|uniref:2-C-methyl-D-erythritol 4-phosphate cytidylyltransferase n=1 Tax=Eiseniibacteriota bacterium TaxID=2212470 RepID=A0A933WBD5_UNCEI|nr:2-C-methyl-D-erythritol 4-phosphate cytidylyltransferase [Candidatus Eisenbacteria bacterium]